MLDEETFRFFTGKDGFYEVINNPMRTRLDSFVSKLIIESIYANENSRQEL